jgi:hypothetical protein
VCTFTSNSSSKISSRPAEPPRNEIHINRPILLPPQHESQLYTLQNGNLISRKPVRSPASKNSIRASSIRGGLCFIRNQPALRVRSSLQCPRRLSMIIDEIQALFQFRKLQGLTISPRCVVRPFACNMHAGTSSSWIEGTSRKCHLWDSWTLRDPLKRRKRL